MNQTNCLHLQEDLFYIFSANLRVTVSDTEAWTGTLSSQSSFHFLFSVSLLFLSHFIFAIFLHLWPATMEKRIKKKSPLYYWLRSCCVYSMCSCAHMIYCTTVCVEIDIPLVEIHASSQEQKVKE